MLLIGRTIEETLMANLPSSTTSVCTEFKEISVDIYTENRVIRSDSRFINHDLVYTREESVKSTNKFQVPTATTNTSIKNTGFILQKSDSKQKLQGRTAVVDTNI